MKHRLFDSFIREKIVAILRGLAPEHAAACGDALARAGVRLMEVPLNRPGALESIRILADHFRGGDIHVGAGTVLRPEDAEAVRAAGGEFIISPNVNCGVIRRTVELGMLSMPGFATPSEAFEAMDAGADLLKIFPCGAPEEIKVIKSVIPLPIFAVGGVSKQNKRAYLKVADGIGIGSGIYRPEFTPEELFRSAKEFMDC